MLEQIGNVDPTCELDDFILTNGLAEIFRVEGMMDHCAILRRMTEADAFLVVQPSTSTQVPGKLCEMIPFGKPILVLTGEGATADIVNRYDLGVVSDPDNVDKITESLRQILRWSGGVGGNQKRALADFNGRNLAKNLADVLSSISIGSVSCYGIRMVRQQRLAVVLNALLRLGGCAGNDV